MIRMKTTGIETRITGPNDDGEYWLHLSGSGESCSINLGKPIGMVSTALLMAASVGLAAPRSGAETTAQMEERVCSCGAGHGSLEGHTEWCDWTSYLALPARTPAALASPEVQALIREAEARGMERAAEAIRAEAKVSPYHSGMTVVYQRGLSDGFEAAAQVADECAVSTRKGGPC